MPMRGIPTSSAGVFNGSYRDTLIPTLRSRRRRPRLEGRYELLADHFIELLLRGEVALASADLQVFLVGGDFDGAVAAIRVEVGGLIGDDILASKLVFDGSEGVSDVLHLEREEGAAAGCFGELFESFVAAEDEAAVVSGDGVDDHLGALRHFDGLSFRDFALIVLAVAENDDGLADGVFGFIFQQFVVTGLVDRVEEGSAAAILQVVDASREQLNVVGEILAHLKVRIETDDVGLIET